MQKNKILIYVVVVSLLALNVVALLNVTSLRNLTDVIQTKEVVQGDTGPKGDTRVYIDSLYLAMYEVLKEKVHHKKETRAYVKKVFDTLYKKEMDILEEALKFSVINPMYQGIIVGDHDVFKDFKNPFAKYVLEHEGKFSLRG